MIKRYLLLTLLVTGLIGCVKIVEKVSHLGGCAYNGKTWRIFGDFEKKPVLQKVISDEKGISIKLSLGGFWEETVTIEGEKYQKLSIPNAGIGTTPGLPQMPFITAMVALPYGVEIAVEQPKGDPVIRREYTIIPAREPWPIFPDAKKPAFTKNEKFYTQDAFFPKELVSIGKPIIMHGIRMAKIVVSPIQYNPGTKDIRVFKQLTFKLAYRGTIDWKATHNARDFMQPEMAGPINRKIVNGKDAFCTPLPHWPDPSPGDPPARYLIITHDDFYDNIVPFGEWKTRKGLWTKIVKTSEIDSLPDTEMIRDYIENLYVETDGALTYVLLVGDANDYIPTFSGADHPFSLWMCPGEPNESDPATDLYYATLTGDDLVPDLYLGRLPVSTSEEADIIINKILQYEQQPDTSKNWPIDILLATAKEDYRTFLITTEWISDLVKDKFKVPHIVCDSVPPYAVTDSVIAWINRGVGIVNHYDHGNSRNGLNPYGFSYADGWKHPHFTVDEIPLLNNGTKLPVMFSINCRTGWYDGNYDCFGEALLKAEGKGIVGFIGASRVSWDGYADELDKGFFDAMFPRYEGEPIHAPQYRLGEILTMGKLYLTEHYIATDGEGYSVTPTPIWDTLTFEMFNLLGDPEMQVFTHQAHPMKVSHLSEIQTTQTHLQVYARQVTNIGGYLEEWPISYAQICLWKDDDLYLVDKADISGRKTFTFSGLTPGTIKVTVTKHNYVPYQGEVSVVE